MNKKFWSQSQTPKKNTYIFDITESRNITISSNFESGNIRLIRQVNSFSYVLESVSDIEGTQGKKSWFYFKIKAWNGVKMKVAIENVNIYQNCLNSQMDFHPLFKVGAMGEWQPLLSSSLCNNESVTLTFEYKFTNLNEVFFCLTVPFTYTDNQIYLSQLQSKILPQISYRDELLSYTPQNREVRLLTITQYASKDTEKQQTYKPVVLITSRVHPGEVTSSFCLMGILQMLLSSSLQGYLLRRLFEWKIVPMVNPDGVVSGNYRMDPYGGNLNRYYRDPDQILQPAVFQIINLIKNVSLPPKRIEFYFDLHSHSSIKEAFIYGNAFDDLIEQTYSQLFCKLLEENNLWFKANLCEFGQKHMKFKDKGQEKTKQGCGRVMAFKIGKVIKSYTLQISILPAFFYKKQKHFLKEPRNKDFQCLIDGYEEPLKYTASNNLDLNPLIAVSSQLGKDLLISILDMLYKNPYSRIDSELIGIYLKESAQRILQKQERFKLFDARNYSKPKIAAKIVQDTFQKELDISWSKGGISQSFNSISWPREVKKIIEQPPVKVKLKVRLQTQKRQQTEIADFNERNMITKTQMTCKDRQISLQRKVKSINKVTKSNEQEREQITSSMKMRKQIKSRQDPFKKIFESVPRMLFQNSFSKHHNHSSPAENSLFDKYIIHNATPMMCLYNSAQAINKKENTIKRKDKLINCYKASISKHKRAFTDLKFKMDSFNDCTLSQGKISLDFSGDPDCQHQRINSLRKRLGKSPIENNKQKQQLGKESIKLPSLKTNKLQPLKGRINTRFLP